MVNVGGQHCHLVRQCASIKTHLHMEEGPRLPTSKQIPRPHRRLTGLRQPGIKEEQHLLPQAIECISLSTPGNGQPDTALVKSKSSRLTNVEAESQRIASANFKSERRGEQRRR